MSWARLDDAFPENPKVENISDRAFRLYIAGLCHCTRNLTDGLISEGRLKTLQTSTKATQKHVAELVSAGLWETVVDGGTVVHDFLDWNPSAREVKRKRGEARERMRDQRSRERSHERSNERSQNVPYGMGKKKSTASRCPECDMGGQLHTADCSRRATA